MAESQSLAASPQNEAPWIRRKRYLEKYDIGSTTYWKWDKQGRIETRVIGGMAFVRDRLPDPTPK
jgi:hypothetical protein